MGRIKGKSMSWVDEGFKENTFNVMRKDGEIRELLKEDEYEFKGLMRSYFERRNVHENRLLGQRIGIESATTLSKQDLVNSLVDKVWGIQYFSLGFTPSRQVDMSSVTAEDELDVLEDIKRGEVIIGEEIEGVFFKRRIGGVLLTPGESFKDARIDAGVVRNLVGEYALEDGDYIKGRIKLYPSIGFCCLIRIDEINGAKLAGGKRADVSGNVVKPYERVPFSSRDGIVVGLELFAPVCYGQFGVISTNARMDFSAAAQTLYSALGEGPEKFLFVYGEKRSAVAEADRKFRESNAFFSALGEEDDGKLNEIIAYAQARAKYCGGKEIIIINDLDALDGDAAKKLASCCSCYDNGGSLTVIAIASTFSLLGNYYAVRNSLDFELSLRSNVEISVTSVDMLGSYSFSDRKVSKSEIIALSKLKQVALSDGAGAVERIVSSGKTADQIIEQFEN